MLTYQTAVLPSGIHLAHFPLPYVESVCIGFWLGVGGRHEPASLQGASHFLEHLLFKGTQRRSARQITEAVEGIGGYFNAFTSEENTCFYAAASASHFERLVDVLADMLQHSTLPPDEVERERGVISEEIRMYEDQPAQFVQERLTALLWPHHGLGRSVTGTLETVQHMSRAQLMQFRKQHHHAGNLWLTVAGNVPMEQAQRILTAALAGLEKRASTRQSRLNERQVSPRFEVKHKETEQTHLALGIRGVSRHDPRRFRLKLLSVLLGENMSSRLFQIVRERHGLAYSIQSSTSYFADTGALWVSAGVENDRFGKAVQLIMRTMKQMALHPVSNAELKRAKEYVIGQLYLGLESTSNQMMWMGESLLGYGRVVTPEEVTAQINAITPMEIQRVGSDLIRDSRLSVAVVSPTATLAQIRRLGRFE